jgi:mono/diheme cytochrome c family protein
MIIRGVVFLLCFALALACSQHDTKTRQYLARGEALYLAHCSNCHQQDGSGLGLVYPPVNTSDYIDKNFESVICLMRNGVKGTMTVNGQLYNQPMPGMPQLTELELAQVATFLYNKWGRKRGIVETAEARQALSRCDSLTANAH